MRAMIYHGVGGIEVIQMDEVPTPEPGDHQVRVRIRAAGLNRADILQRKGRYPAPSGWPANIPGMEYSGEIARLGRGTTRWQVGDRVMGLVGGGAHAEGVVVHEDEILAIPAGMGFGDAASIAEAFLTAYDALVFRGRLTTGERVLIHAVGSGLGTAASQIARFLGASTVLGTSRTIAKLERAREYGVDIGLDTSQHSFRERIDPPVNVIIDVLGGAALEDNLAVLAPRGRLVVLGFLGSATTNADLSPILRKRLEIIGSVMRTRTLGERVELITAFRDRILPGFVTSVLRPVVGAVFPFEELGRAHEAMERNETFGKIVLEWEASDK